MSNGDVSPAGTSALEGATAAKPDSVVPVPSTGGVTLLLRGSDRNVGAPSVPSSAANGSPTQYAEVPGASGRTHVPASSAQLSPSMPPGWIPWALFSSDLVMVAVAALWASAGSGDWRWIGIGALLVVGCVQAVVAWTLFRPSASGDPAPRGPTETSVAPRIRVHFVDETPRHRR